MTDSSKVMKRSIKLGVVSLSLCGVLAHAGLFSWLLDGKDKEQSVAIKESRRVVVRTDAGQVPSSPPFAYEETTDNHEGHDHSIERDVGTEADYQRWLNQDAYHKQNATAYQEFLVKQLGKDKVPPFRELLTTARAWQKCGYEPYQVPPSDLWHQMVPTIRLYNDLKKQGILPPQTQIRSAYRNPDLNRCAGGAPSSKHMTNGAIDIWVPDYPMNSWQMNNVQEKLCQFWIDNGSNYQFGLGIYGTGAIHLDTQGYRKWGGQFTPAGSACRYVIPKPEQLYIDGQGWANAQ